MSEAAIPLARRSNWPAVYIGAAGVLGAVLAFLLWSVPLKDGVRQWTAPMIPGGWMAWTFPVALFFWTIASLLVLFTILAVTMACFRFSQESAVQPLLQVPGKRRRKPQPG